MTNQDEMKALCEEREKMETFINDISCNCERMSVEILKNLCKRAIKGMNTVEPSFAGSTDDYPKDFKFFDILCIELESKNYEEINPGLYEFVERFLIDEYNKLPSMERFILDHSECWAMMDNEDKAIKDKIFEAFNQAKSAHLKLKKIENYMLKN